MNGTDNIQAQIRILQMENVRLTNKTASLEKYIRFVEEENRNVEREIREECRLGMEMRAMERDRAIVQVEQERKRADMAESLLEETRRVLGERNLEVSRLKKEVKNLKSFKDIAVAAEEACLDSREVINIINRRVFQRNSDATRFLNDEVDPNAPMLEESPLADVVSHVIAKAGGMDSPRKTSPGKVIVKETGSELPPGKPRAGNREDAAREFRHRRVYTATILEEVGIDTGSLPQGGEDNQTQGQAVRRGCLVCQAVLLCRPQSHLQGIQDRQVQCSGKRPREQRPSAGPYGEQRHNAEFRQILPWTDSVPKSVSVHRK